MICSDVLQCTNNMRHHVTLDIPFFSWRILTKRWTKIQAGQHCAAGRSGNDLCSWFFPTLARPVAGKLRVCVEECEGTVVSSGQPAIPSIFFWPHMKIQFAQHWIQYQASSGFFKVDNQKLSTRLISFSHYNFSLALKGIMGHPLNVWHLQVSLFFFIDAWSCTIRRDFGNTGAHQTPWSWLSCFRLLWRVSTKP